MIAQRYGHDPDWVKARLRRADVPLRAPGRQATTDEDRVRSLLDHGLRVPEIAGALDCSTTTVLTIMRKHGWVGPPRRPRGPNRTPPPTPDPAVLRRLYVDEGLSIGTVAERLHLRRARRTSHRGRPGQARVGCRPGASPDQQRATATAVRRPGLIPGSATDTDPPAPEPVPVIFSTSPAPMTT